LNAQVSEEDVEQLRENIFYIICHIKNKVCNMIMDNGSCTNVVSTTLVTNLNLSATDHVIPYKFQWLNEYEEFRVTTHVLISFLVGRYNDKVLCEVSCSYTCCTPICWGDFGNLIVKPSMMVLKISIH
jgi:hypothetical protein